MNKQIFVDNNQKLLLLSSFPLFQEQKPNQHLNWETSCQDEKALQLIRVCSPLDIGEDEVQETAMAVLPGWTSDGWRLVLMKLQTK